MNNRIKNIKKGALTGGALRIFQILLGFVMRSILIHVLGMQYVGLNSLFSSVMQVLNLAELGVSSAMGYSLYEPIANGNIKRINSILNLYKKYYCCIGGVVLGAGLLILPFIKYFVSGDIPDDINIYILYTISLLSTSTSYWLFGYRTTVLIANQRMDVFNSVYIMTTFIQYGLQITAVVIFRSYYLYSIGLLLISVLMNLICAYKSKMLFPEMYPEGTVDLDVKKKINSSIKDLFLVKIAGVILNSFDSIVISTFLGLVPLAIYNNYYFILTSVSSMIGQIYTVAVAGIGNSLITDNKQKVFNDFQTGSFIVTWLLSICTGCFLVLYQPFMEIWVGEDNMFDYSVVICFAAYFFTYELTMFFASYKDAAGMWKKDKYRSITAAIVNLVLNLLMIRSLGVYGVILSTVISMVLINIPWIIKNLMDDIFKMTVGTFLKYILKNIAVMLGVVIVSVCIINYIPYSGIVGLIVKAIGIIGLPNFLLFCIYKRSNEFKKMREYIKR